MATTKEIFDSLLAATDNVAAKRVALDKANEAMAKASQEFDAAVVAARKLRQALDEALSIVSPALIDNERARVSA